MSMFNCCGLCAPLISLTNEDMILIEKQLGNIKLSHKAITFTGLVHLAGGRAQYIHYLTSAVFCQHHRAGLNAEQEEIAANQQVPLKIGQSHLKKKIEGVLEQMVSFRIAQTKMAKELGFEFSRETFIRGETSIVLMVEILQDFLLVVLMEMNPLKVDFFDCDQYITTIDDLVQSLIDIIDKPDDGH